MNEFVSDQSVLDFFTLFDAVDVGIIVVNKQSEIIVWNDWIEKYSFYELDNVLTKHLDQIFKDLPPRLSQVINDALNNGMSAYLSERFNKHPLALYSSNEDKEKTKRIYQKISVRPFTLRNERMCVIQITDVTHDAERTLSLRKQTNELKALADAAKEKQLELSSIIDNSLDAIIRLNQSGRIISFYGSAINMFGYKELDVLGKPFSTLLPNPFNMEFDRFFLTGEETQNINVDGKAKAKTIDGDIFYCEITVNPLIKLGEVQFIITIKDVSERTLAEAALHQQKEQAEITLNSIADGVITTDVIGRINYINPAAQLLAGLTSEEVELKLISKVLNIKSENAELPTVTCIQQGIKVESTNGDELISPDGSIIVIHQLASPIHNVVGDVIGSVLIIRDVSQSHRLASRLTWQASHDELTQLFNRREFERQLEGVIQSARNENAEHSLCFMDLDKFKAVNDTCGHAAGDELLKQLADIFRSKIRGADVLARLGGDEFGIILTKCNLAHAKVVAEQIRSAVEEYRFIWGGRSFQVGVSIGLVSVDVTTPDVDEVFVASDSACYAAKEAGRNRVHVYSPDDAEIAQRQGEAQWLVQLQSALDEDRFKLYFQPIVPIQDRNSVIHYEILLRMLDEKGQIIPPGAFIPSAERYQMMSKIDRWVIKHLFDWMDRYWVKNDMEIFAINLSGQTIADPLFLKDIKIWLEKCTFDPQNISFEITETAAISNLKMAQQFIDELKQIGCGFALDDFGSGLSSFAYLKNMPVDFLKIDGVFVRDINEDVIDKAMVEAIHNVGNVLNLKTIAEFVEDDDVIKILEEIGIDYAQGYGIDRPKPLPQNSSKLFTWH